MSGAFRIAMHGITHPGGRDHNEDAIDVLPEQGAALIADGMGGLERGEVASQTVVSTLSAAIRAGGDLPSAVQKAHFQLIQLRSGQAGDRLGSTVVCLSLEEAKAHIFWVGDSRAYRLRDGALTQITVDHSLVGQLLHAGAITEAEAATHPQRHVLTRALGAHDDAPELDTTTCDIVAGDRLLLCSDGLSGFAAHDDIASTLAVGDAEEAAKKLIELGVVTHRSSDNVSVVVITIEA